MTSDINALLQHFTDASPSFLLAFVILLGFILLISAFDGARNP